MSGSLPLRTAIRFRPTKVFVFVVLFFVPAGLALYFFVNDIIALVLAASLAVWMTASLVSSLTLALILKKKEGLRVVPPEARDEIVPNVPALLVLVTPPFSLVPGFSLEIEPRFERGDAVFPSCILSGGDRESRRIPMTVRFPHRGEWTTDRAILAIHDPLGFFHVRWEKALPSQCTVVPPSAEGRMFPILTSTHRPGDDQTDLQNKEGDLFELKPYDPADGARKILWKVFARRRELIARHPEAAMSPEGRVVMYAMAGQHDDALAAEILQYLYRLEDLGLEVFFSCAGASSGIVARTAEEARSLLIESVWSCALGDTPARRAEVEALMGAATKGGLESSLSRIIIFGSGATVDGAEGGALATALYQAIVVKATPTFFITTDSSSRGAPQRGSALSRFLFETEPSSRKHDESRRTNFLAARVAERWDIVSL